MGAEEERALRYIHDAKDETIRRDPGSISGTDCAIENLHGCVVYILDHSQQITVDDCVDCTIVIGPCDGSVFLRDSQDCTFITASRQLRTRGLTNCKLFMYSATDPAVEASTNLQIGTWNVSYPLLDKHFGDAKLDPTNNAYKRVHDFSEGDKNIPNPHYVFMEQEEVDKDALLLSVEGLEQVEPVNPVQAGGKGQSLPSSSLDVNESIVDGQEEGKTNNDDNWTGIWRFLCCGRRSKAQKRMDAYR